MNPILFEKDATTFTGRGLYTISDSISCTVTEERNGEFELELVYPINGQFLHELIIDRIIVAIPFQGGTKQAFRIYRREATLEGEIVFRARHISYQLNFIPISVTVGSTNSAQTMMETVSSAAEINCPFSFESDIVTSGARAYNFSIPCGIRAALGGIEGSVLDTFGGEFEWDNWTVKLHENRGADNGVRITYAKNMTELDDALDIGDTITGVMAFAQYQDENGNDVTVYSSPKVISVSPNPYAHERVVSLDISDQFDTTPTQLDVTTYATAWLSRTSQVDPTREITLSFVPMHQTTEYLYGAVETVKLCDTVHIRYPAIGLDITKKVCRCVWNVLADRYDEITLGQEQTLADTIVEMESNTIETKSSGGINLLDVYPIGSFYISLSSVSPEILFGGQWDRITGKFLLAGTDGGAQGGNSTANVAPTFTGGEATHKLTAAESGVPKHKHTIQSKTQQGYQSGTNKNGYNAGGTGAAALDPGCQENTAQNAQNAHNNMPPYLSVYMWTRIA